MINKPLISWAILGLASATWLSLHPTPIAISAMPSPRATPPAPRATPKATPASKALAKELQGKPVLVDIYADWCGGCQAIKPTLTTLRKQYAGKVNFVVFNVTNKTTTAAAQAEAQRLGLSAFFAENKSKTATVAILNPANAQVLKLYQGNPTIEDYQTVIDGAMTAKR
jgi:thiol-disulfide isomerase/thioredoxin